MLRRLLIDNGYLAVQYAAGALIPLVLVPHLVHEVGAAAFGRVAMVISVMSYLGVIVQYAFQLTGPAALADRHDAGERASLFFEFFVARLTLLALTLLLLLAGLVFAFAVGGTPILQTPSLWLVLAGLPIAAALNAGWMLQAGGRFAVLALISAASAVAATALGLQLLCDGAVPLPLAAGLLVMAPLLTAIGTLIAVLTRLPVPAQWPSRAAVAHRLREGWAIFVSQFVAALYGFSGPLVVGLVAGERAAGLYAAIERAAVAVQGALLQTYAAAYPRLAAYFTSDRRAYRRQLRLAAVIYLAGAAAIAVGVWAFGDRLAYFLTAENSADVGRLLWLAVLWIALGIVGTALTGHLTIGDRQRELLPLTAKVLAVSLVVGVVATRWLGAAGWMAGLIAGQLVVVYAAVGVGRGEHRGRKQLASPSE